MNLPSNQKTTAKTLLFLAAAVISFGAWAADETAVQLDDHFSTTVKPFLQTYCIDCHGKEKTEADLNLAAYSSMTAVVKDSGRLDTVIERLEAEEMPPKKAKQHPSMETRRQAIEWFQALRDYETLRNAGDPGVVLARRLSNAEYDYSVRDLIGVDLKPTREFPADPSNMAGFDNSGESLVMSPSLLKKYLEASRDVANHMFLKPDGFAFAPYPMIVETDRDKFCVMQIIDFYHQQNIDYADYFQAAWRFKNRAALGKPKAKLTDFAAADNVSAKYLTTIWTTLEGTKAKIGPLVKLQAMWTALPKPVAKQTEAARAGCEQMRDYVVQLRKKVEPRFPNITAGKLGVTRQPLLIWKDVQYATHRRTFDPAQLQVVGEPAPVPSTVEEPGTKDSLGPGKTQILTNAPGDPDLMVPAGQRAHYEAAFAKFCSVFPDMFYKQERGRNYFDTAQDRGRYLSAGFHNVMGYFRDDEPLYELLLDEQQQKQLDEMWREMDFIASTTIRMYVQFAGFSETAGNDGVAIATGKISSDLPEDKEISSEPRMQALEKKFLEQAQGANETGINAVKDYFAWVDTVIRQTEKARIDAEPVQLVALQQFAEHAYRRPLSNNEKSDLLANYRSLREKDGLSHEEAMRESIMGVLMSPDLTYRIDLVGAGQDIQPLSDYDLASRLSYFLWSSLPDKELLAHAAAGDLHQPKVIAAQAQRMMKDPRIRALAVEFGGNWLDFRRFEGIGTVDVERFPEFNSELKEAMFEEPVYFLMDVFQNNRSILDCLYAKDTFVNPVLATHYGMPVAGVQSNEWVRIADASQYGRGGILPMAVFLTKNAPGLRTSPVKRGNWVVKNVLGERIPPPPAVVPELPHDEAKMDLPLPEMLARHRADPNCAACHARFDSMGLVFEGFGPIGERREKDLAGRAIDAKATFPGGGEGAGLAGLRQYIRDKRQNDFIDNLCSKLLVYALGRSVMLSDDSLLKETHGKLAADDYRFGNLIECIVTSKQFLTKRGSDNLATTEK
jgi:Protein of unknown function (DUF1592)/Protein of unknown function (DUF1588)/Protein of unknown function (DUF1587)/Protein of unknown function (DUF1585)/Protein of unknown function (DUF1595)/Planctomycete cytochrome C